MSTGFHSSCHSPAGRVHARRAVPEPRCAHVALMTYAEVTSADRSAKRMNPDLHRSPKPFFQLLSVICHLDRLLCAPPARKLELDPAGKPRGIRTPEGATPLKMLDPLVSVSSWVRFVTALFEPDPTTVRRSGLSYISESTEPNGSGSTSHFHASVTLRLGQRTVPRRLSRLGCLLRRRPMRRFLCASRLRTPISGSPTARVLASDSARTAPTSSSGPGAQADPRRPPGSWEQCRPF